MDTRNRIGLPEKRGTCMLIDTHCHVDQFSSPEEVVQECEMEGMRVVAVTNLPSHFIVTADRLRGHPLVCAALGSHPLSAANGIRELAAFKRMAPHADYIGEIGLDFSNQGMPSKALQERLFEEILHTIKGRPRFITLHSKGAEYAVLESLHRHKIRGAVFHWFSGSAKDLAKVIDDGHLVSVNVPMLSSLSGRRVVECAPMESILVESVAPFAKMRGKLSHPRDIKLVYETLALQWGKTFKEVTDTVKSNYERIISQFEK